MPWSAAQSCQHSNDLQQHSFNRNPTSRSRHFPRQRIKSHAVSRNIRTGQFIKSIRFFWQKRIQLTRLVSFGAKCGNGSKTTFFKIAKREIVADRLPQTMDEDLYQDVAGIRQPTIKQSLCERRIRSDPIRKSGVIEIRSACLLIDAKQPAKLNAIHLIF